MGSGVAQKTVRGVALLGANTAVSKVVNSGAQLVLAALLVPEDFGVVAYAFVIFSFVSVFERFGIRETLIRQQSRLRRWSNASLWLSGVLGLVAMGLMFAAAPVMARVWEEPRLVLVASVLALALPFQTLVPALEAHLEVDLRYKGVMLVSLACNVMRAVLSIALALLGFGALSFVIPWVAHAFVRCVALIAIARPRVRGVPQLRRWPGFFRVGGWFLGATLCEIAMLQMGATVIGLVSASAAAGAYYFAFGQSMQLVQLFVVNVSRVVMPGLTAMEGGVTAQVRAFLRALRLLALLFTPMGVLQAAAAGPFLRLLFGDRWLAAIPLMQLLSLAAVFTALGGLSISLINAQGRSRTLFWSRVTGFVLMALGCVYGAVLGVQAEQPVLGVVLGIVAARLLYGPLNCYIACRPGRVAFWRIAIPFFSPLVGAGLSAAAAVWVVGLFPTETLWFGRDFEALRLITTVGVFGPLYLAWVLVFHRASFNEVRYKVVPMLTRRRGGAPAAA